MFSYNSYINIGLLFLCSNSVMFLSSYQFILLTSAEANLNFVFDSCWRLVTVAAGVILQ